MKPRPSAGPRRRRPRFPLRSLRARGCRAGPSRICGSSSITRILFIVSALSVPSVAHRIDCGQRALERVFTRDREVQRERAAAVGLALDAHEAAVAAHGVIDDRQAEAGALRTAAQLALHAIELAEDAALLAPRDADAVIGDADHDVAVGAPGRRPRWSSRRRNTSSRWRAGSRSPVRRRPRRPGCAAGPVRSSAVTAKLPCENCVSIRASTLVTDSCRSAGSMRYGRRPASIREKSRMFSISRVSFFASPLMMPVILLRALGRAHAAELERFGEQLDQRQRRLQVVRHRGDEIRLELGDAHFARRRAGHQEHAEAPSPRPARSSAPVAAACWRSRFP